MALNPFSHEMDVEKLEGWLSDVTEELATGASHVAFNAGDSGGTDYIWKDITPLQRQIWLKERLSQLLPDDKRFVATNTYPVRRTRPRYLG